MPEQSKEVNELEHRSQWWYSECFLPLGVEELSYQLQSCSSAGTRGYLQGIQQP